MVLVVNRRAKDEASLKMFAIQWDVISVGLIQRSDWLGNGNIASANINIMCHKISSVYVLLWAFVNLGDTLYVDEYFYILISELGA